MDTTSLRYRERFPGRHTVFPVIHVESEEQAARNTRVARDAGTEGVFLINHGLTDEDLLEVHSKVAEAHPDWWLGVNCLGWAPAHVFRSISRKVAGVWVDNARIEEAEEKQSYAEHVMLVRAIHAPDCLFFGGVAFNYQREVDDLESACRTAAKYMDVVTTSGPGTGEAADIDKISRMRKALGEAPLAIASGITPENVADYLAGINVDDVVRATSLSRRVLEARFANLLGRTPHDEFLRVRLERTKQLLAETDVPLAAIARRVGYEHPEYLSVVFKSQTGTTPSEYRATAHPPAHAATGGKRRRSRR